MNLKLNNIVLSSYDKDNDRHRKVLLEFLGESKSNYIHDIDRRLKNNYNKKENNIFDRGYLVSLNNNIVGYIFISKIIRDEIFLEYSIIKSYREKKIGKLLLSDVTNYLLDNYNIKSIVLDIEPSNVPSIMTAVSCGYMLDDEEYVQRNMNGKILYRMDNFNYINKRKK